MEVLILGVCLEVFFLDKRGQKLRYILYTGAHYKWVNTVMHSWATLAATLLSMMFLCPSPPSNAVNCQSCVYTIFQTNIERGREGRDVSTNMSKSVGQLLCGN